MKLLHFVLKHIQEVIIIMITEGKVVQQGGEFEFLLWFTSRDIF